METTLNRPTDIVSTLDFPENWANKSVSSYDAALDMGWLLAGFGVILAGWKTFALLDFVPYPGSPYWVAVIGFLVVGAVLVKVGFKLRKAHEKYVSSFFKDLGVVAKERYGLDLTLGQIKNLVGYGEVFGRASIVDTNLGDKRITVRLDTLLDGKDIRFYYSGTDEEVAQVTTSVAPVSERQSIDLPPNYGEPFESVKFILWTIPFVVVAFALVLSIPAFEWLKDIQPANELFSWLSISILIGVTIAAVLYSLMVIFGIREAKKLTAQREEGWNTFMAGVESNYGITLPPREAWLLYMGNAITIEANNTRMNVRISVLPNGKDARLVYKESDVEIPTVTSL